MLNVHRLPRQDQSFLHRIRDIHFLVIDEADRMTEKGHFAELDKFFTALSSEQ